MKESKFISKLCQILERTKLKDEPLFMDIKDMLDGEFGISFEVIDDLLISDWSVMKSSDRQMVIDEVKKMIEDSK